MSEASPGTIAAANLLHSVCSAFHASGQRGAIVPMLTMFEGMNAMLDGYPADRAALDAAVSMQRKLLEQLGG